jgi:hypothetical protein
MHWKKIMEAIRFKANKRNKPKLLSHAVSSMKGLQYSSSFIY